MCEDIYPRESWLKSEDSHKAAAAMVRCKHAGAHCFGDGYCHYDGDCFAMTIVPRSDYEALVSKVERLTERVDALFRLHLKQLEED